jgi:pimeloyl-ACP methyl ester carboxylesterase
MNSPIRSGQYANLPNGMRLHYASAGSPGRPLVLFVHGFPEAWFAWEAQLEAFGTRFYAVALDLRGFNLSDKPVDVNAYRSRKIIADLELMIAHLGYGESQIVAHDWGGAVAWQLAILAPQRVRRLVIVNAPHPYVFARELRENAAQRQASAYMNRLRKPGAELLLAENDFQRLDELFTVGAANGTGGGAGAGSDATRGARHWYDDALRQRYHAMWSIAGEHGSHGLTGSLNYYRASGLHPPTDDDPTISVEADPQRWIVHVPVRVIWGMQDTALLPSLLEGLTEFCADLRITHIDGGSHWVIHEQPARVNALIAQALDAAC